MSSRKSRDGKSVQFTAPVGGVTEGVFYQIDGIIGLCMVTADATYESTLNVEIAHYETTQIDDTDDFDKGDKVFWDEANERFTTVGASGLPFIGIVTTAKDDDDVVEFILLPQAGVNVPFIQMPVQADSTASDVAGVVADLNSLLSKLKTAGLMATS